MYLRKGVGSVTLVQGVTRVEDPEEVTTIDTLWSYDVNLSACICRL